MPWGLENGTVRLNVLTASYFDPLSPLYFETFDKLLGTKNHGSFQRRQTNVLFFWLKGTYNLSTTCPVRGRTFRPVVVFAHELQLTPQTVWREKAGPWVDVVGEAVQWWPKCGISHYKSPSNKLRWQKHMTLFMIWMIAYDSNIF